MDLSQQNTMFRTYTTNASKTFSVDRLKAKNLANQAGLDRLQEAYVKAAANPNSGQNYAAVIKRAMRSLQECKEPILTQKDALKLKFVGQAMAKKICPQSTGVGTSKASKQHKGKSTAKSKATTKGRLDEDEEFINFLSEAAVAPSALGPPPTGLPLVCPHPTVRSTSRYTTTFETFSSAKEHAYAAAKAEAERLVLPPRGPWKVILLVDIREHKSKQVVSSCKQAGIPCEERQLAIGDMAWIARCVVPNENCTSMLAASAGASKKRKKAGDDDKFRTIEILVGTIVERKEVNDLASSLFGTRYAEQRLRLSQSGLPQVLFLVEGNLSAVDNCPAETLQMAMMETRINLGFQIVHTKHLTETVNTLKTLHSRIVQRTFPDAFGKSSTRSSQQIALPSFGGGNHRRANRRASSLLELVFDTAPVPPFGSKRFITYPELKAKVEVDRERGTRSVRAISLAMLKQIPTLSQKKCTAIANHYPTLNRLLTALSYPDASSQSGGTNGQKHHPKKVVEEIEIDSGRRTIGPKSASEIYKACCTLQDGSTVNCHEQDRSQATVNLGQPRKPSFLFGANDFDNDDTENRKPPPTTESNFSIPMGSSKRGKVPVEKARTKDTSHGTNTTVINVGNSMSRFLESSGVPEAVPRAFSNRKRPAPITTTERSDGSASDPPLERHKKQSNDINLKHSRFEAGSPLRRKQPQIQETVDLLTPESSAKPKAKPASTKKLTAMNLSDWSDSSDEDFDAMNKSRKSSPLVTNFCAKNDNIAEAVASQRSNLKRQGIFHKNDALLLSSDEEDSPFPKNISMTGAHKNRDSNNLESSSRVASTEAAANRLSLDTSPGDSSFLFSSPDVNKITKQRKAEFGASQNDAAVTKSRWQTNTSDKDNDNGVVCLLDDSDDESSCDAGEGLARKANTKISSIARDALVTTTRGGALPSTQESRYGDDSENNSSDEDLKFGTSLRKRLGAIRGRDLKEVIELDSDSD